MGEDMTIFEKIMLKFGFIPTKRVLDYLNTMPHSPQKTAAGLTLFGKSYYDLLESYLMKEEIVTQKFTQIKNGPDH